MRLSAAQGLLFLIAVWAWDDHGEFVQVAQISGVQVKVDRDGYTVGGCIVVLEPPSTVLPPKTVQTFQSVFAVQADDAAALANLESQLRRAIALTFVIDEDWVIVVLIPLPSGRRLSTSITNSTSYQANGTITYPASTEASDIPTVQAVTDGIPDIGDNLDTVFEEDGVKATVVEDTAIVGDVVEETSQTLGPITFNLEFQDASAFIDDVSNGICDLVSTIAFAYGGVEPGQIQVTRTELVAGSSSQVEVDYTLTVPPGGSAPTETSDAVQASVQVDLYDQGYKPYYAMCTTPSTNLLGDGISWTSCDNMLVVAHNATCYANCFLGWDMDGTGKLRCVDGSYVNEDTGGSDPVGCTETPSCGTMPTFIGAGGAWYSMTQESYLEDPPGGVRAEAAGVVYSLYCPAPSVSIEGWLELQCSDGFWQLSTLGGLERANATFYLTCIDQPCSGLQMPANGLEFLCIGSDHNQLCSMRCADGYQRRPSLWHYCTYTTMDTVEALASGDYDTLALGDIPLYNTSAAPDDAVAAFISSMYDSHYIGSLLHTETYAPPTSNYVGPEACTVVQCPQPSVAGVPPSAVSMNGSTSELLGSGNEGIKHVVCSGQALDDTCEAICNDGYFSSGAQLLCGPGGHFVGTLSCAPGSCTTEPEMLAGAVDSGAVVDSPCRGEARCDVACAAGYEGTAAFICDASKQLFELHVWSTAEESWMLSSDNPCTPLPCSGVPPDVAGDGTAETCTGLQSGDVCLACDAPGADPNRCVSCPAGRTLAGNVACSLGILAVSGAGCIDLSTDTTTADVLKFVFSATSVPREPTDSATAEQVMSTLLRDAGTDAQDCGEQAARELAARSIMSGEMAAAAFYGAVEAGSTTEFAVDVSMVAAISAGQDVASAASQVFQLGLKGGAPPGEFYTTVIKVCVARGRDAAEVADCVQSAQETSAPLSVLSNAAAMVPASIVASQDVAVVGHFAGELVLAPLKTSPTPLDSRRGAEAVRKGYQVGGQAWAAADKVAAYAMLRVQGHELGDDLSAARSYADSPSAQALLASDASDRSAALFSYASDLDVVLAGVDAKAAVFLAFAVTLEYSPLGASDAVQVAVGLALCRACGRDELLSSANVSSCELSREAGTTASMVVYLFGGDPFLAADGAVRSLMGIPSFVDGTALYQALAYGMIEFGMAQALTRRSRDYVLDLWYAVTGNSTFPIKTSWAISLYEAYTPRQMLLDATEAVAQSPAGSTSQQLGLIVAEWMNDDAAPFDVWCAAAVSVFHAMVESMPVEQAALAGNVAGYAASSMHRLGKQPRLATRALSNDYALAETAVLQATYVLGASSSFDPGDIGKLVLQTLSDLERDARAAVTLPVALQYWQNQEKSLYEAMVAADVSEVAMRQIVDSCDSQTTAYGIMDCFASASAAAFPGDAHYVAVGAMMWHAVWDGTAVWNGSSWWAWSPLTGWKVAEMAVAAACASSGCASLDTVEQAAHTVLPLVAALQARLVQLAGALVGRMPLDRASPVAWAADALSIAASLLEASDREAMVDGGFGAALGLAAARADLPFVTDAEVSSSTSLTALTQEVALARSYFQVSASFSGWSFAGNNPQYQEMAARFDAAAYAGGTSEQAAIDASRAWLPQAPGNAIFGAGLLGFTRSLIPSRRPFDAMDNTIWINTAVDASWGQDVDFSSRDVACFGFVDDPNDTTAPVTVCAESLAGAEDCSLHIYSAQRRSCNSICADNPESERTCVQARFFAANQAEDVCTLGEVGDAEEDGCDMVFGPNTSGTCTCSGARYSVNLNGYYVIAGARVDAEKMAILDLFQLVKGFAPPPAGTAVLSTEQIQAATFDASVDSGLASAAYAAADTGFQEGLSKAQSLANAGELMLLHVSDPGSVLQTAAQVMMGENFIVDGVEREEAMLLLSQRVLAQTGAGTRAVFRSDLLDPLESNTLAQQYAWQTLPWPVPAGRPLEEIAEGIVDSVSFVTTDETVHRGAAFASVLKSGGTVENAAAVTAYVTGPTADAMCQDLAHLLFAYGRSADETKDQISNAIAASGAVCDVDTIVDQETSDVNVARLLTSPALNIQAADQEWYSDQVQTPAPTFAFGGTRRLQSSSTTPAPASPPTVNGSVTISALWATQYQASIVRALSGALGVEVHQLVIESIGSLSTSRRLGSSTDSRHAVARMLGTSDGFTIDFVITPEAGDDVSQISTKVEDLQDTSSNTWDLFINTLNNELAGDPDSQAAFADVLVTIPGGVAGEQYTYVSTPEWTTSAWSSCSNTCGDGFESRTIGCSSAWDYSACYVLGEEPDDIKACKSCDGCPYFPDCPLGKCHSLTCDQQFAILMGIIAFIILLIILRILLYIRRKLRQPKKGKYRVGELHDSVSWAIVPNGDKDEVAVETGATRAFASLTSSRRTKMHIVWDVTASQVQEWCGNPEPSAQASYDELVDDAEDAAIPLGVVPNPVKPPEVLTAEILLRDTNTYFDELPDDFKVFVRTGDSVEYFSDRHKTWLAASVRVKMTAGVTPEAQYDLRLGATAQVRLAVPISSIRPALRRGEPCYFFSAKDDCWVPAFVIAKDAVSSVVGYTVRLLDLEIDVPGLAANRLKRRYPSGSVVEVYRGVGEGWLPAVVMDEIHPDPDDKEDAVLAAQREVVSGQGRPAHLGYHEAPKHKDGRDVQYSSTVVVRQEADPPGLAGERVQSHLVRFPEAYVREGASKLPMVEEPISIEDQPALAQPSRLADAETRFLANCACTSGGEVLDDETHTPHTFMQDYVPDDGAGQGVLHSSVALDLLDRGPGHGSSPQPENGHR